MGYTPMRELHLYCHLLTLCLVLSSTECKTISDLNENQAKTVLKSKNSRSSSNSRRSTELIEEFSSDSFSRECIEEKCDARELEETVEQDTAGKNSLEVERVREERITKIERQCDYGRCMKNSTKSCVDYYNGYLCICLPGYRGLNCEVKAPGVKFSQNDYILDHSQRAMISPIPVILAL